MKPRPLTFQEFNRKVEAMKKPKRIMCKRQILVAIAVVCMFSGIAMIEAACQRIQASQQLLSPYVPDSPTPAPTVAPVKRAVPRAKVDDRPRHTGLASYYSRSGCLGCSSTLHMANSEPLDDTKLTVAFNRAKLGSHVKITNAKNGKSVTATVTDRGGFEKHGRIIDLTIATRDAIECSHLCKVEVEVL